MTVLLAARTSFFANSFGVVDFNKNGRHFISDVLDANGWKRDEQSCWNKNGLPPCKVVLKDKQLFDSRHPPILLFIRSPQTRIYRRWHLLSIFGFSSILAC